MRRLKFLFLVTLVGIAGCENGEAARRQQTLKNLKQIGLALHASYHGRNAESANKNESAPSDEAPKTADQAVEIVEPPPSVPE